MHFLSLIVNEPISMKTNDHEASFLQPIQLSMFKSMNNNKSSPERQHISQLQPRSVLRPPPLTAKSSRSDGTGNFSCWNEEYLKIYWRFAIFIGKEDEVSSSEEIVRLHSTISPTSSSHSNDPDIVFESAAKLLFLAVKWTKSIPSFNQLNAADQNLLLEECWAELFVIMSAQYGLPIGSK